MKKKKNAFTLIELLGVIIIISLIITIITLTVSKVLKSGKEKADKQLEENIIMAAKLWGSDHQDELPEPGLKKNVWLTDLQKEGYIDKNIKLPSSGQNIEEACVEILNKTKENSTKKVFDYVFNADCTISMDLVIKGTIGSRVVISGEWVNSDILLTASSSYSGKYQWYKGESKLNGETKATYTASVSQNTESTVTYNVEQTAEKNTYKATYIAAIDKKAPTLNVVTKVDVKDNLTVSFSEGSDSSGLAKYAVTTSASAPAANASEWVKISGKSASATLTKDTGVYYVYVMDGAGNITSRQVNVVALAPPTCSISLNPGSPSGSNGWYKSDVTVNMTTSGVVNTKGLATSSGSTNGLTSAVHSIEGNNIVYYGFVQNDAGANSCKSASFKLDKTAPTFSSVYNSGGNAWRNSSMYISANLSDNLSGVDASSVGYNYGSGTLYKDWDSVSTTAVKGTWEAERYAPAVNLVMTDNAGNQATVGAGSIMIDKTPPWDLQNTYFEYEPSWGYSHTTVTEFGENFAMKTVEYQYCYIGTSCGSVASKNCNNTSIYNQPWQNSTAYWSIGTQAYRLQLGYGCDGYSVQLRVRLTDAAGNTTILPVYTVGV